MSAMTQSARISYGLMAVLLVLIGWLHMATLVLTGMFGYFALRALMSVCRNKTLAVVLYAVLVVGIGYGAVTLTRKAYKALPKIAEDSIPAVVEFAEKQGVELPFTDFPSLKTQALAEVKALDVQTRLNLRYDKFRNMGRLGFEFVEEA